MAVLRRFSLATISSRLGILGVVTSLSRAAWACPACVGNGRGTQLLKIGSILVLLPFAVVAVVLYVLRHAPERREPQR